MSRPELIEEALQYTTRELARKASNERLKKIIERGDLYEEAKSYGLQIRPGLRIATIVAILNQKRAEIRRRMEQKEREVKEEKHAIQVTVGHVHKFKDFRYVEIEIRNALSANDLWDAYQFVIDMGRPNAIIRTPTLFFMHLRYVSLEHGNRYITIHPDYLGDRKEFEDRLEQIRLGEVTGSDPIDEQDFHLDTTYMRLSYRDSSGKGARPRYAFAKIIENKDPEAGGCLYRAVRLGMTEAQKTRFDELIEEQQLEQIKNDKPEAKASSALPLASEMIGKENTSVMEFNLILAKMGCSIILYADYPSDFECKKEFVKLEGKRYLKITCTGLKKLSNGLKAYKYFNLVYGDYHFEALDPQMVKNEPVYEDANKNLHFYENEKFITIERNCVYDSASIKLGFDQNIVSYDLETTFDSADGSKLKPYSIAWIEGSDYDHERDAKKSTIFYTDKPTIPTECAFKFGGGCIENFIGNLRARDTNQLYCLLGYNSSRFDNNFLVQEFCKNDILNDIFYQKNSILNIKWGGRHLTFDICRYTMASLAATCKSFNTRFKKMGDFDHNEIQKYYNENGDVHRFFHEPECENTCETLVKFKIDNELDLDKKLDKKHLGCDCIKYRTLCKYNLLDVLSTKEIYVKIETFLEEIKVLQNNARLFDIKTIGSCIYRLFKEKLKLHLPRLKLTEYNMIRGGLAAGRTQCYYGPSFDLSSTRDYRMVDVKSLYPYIMLNRRFPHGKVKYMKYSQMNPEQIGFFTCTFNQQNLKIKVLPRRHAGEPLDWKYDGNIEACISTVDINCLKKNGGNFFRIGLETPPQEEEDLSEEASEEAEPQIEYEPSLDPMDGYGLVFEKTIAGSELFSCINDFKRIKEEEDAKPAAERNSVRRNMAKLFMNSLSGKVIENLHLEKTVIVRKQSQIDRMLEQVERPETDIVLEDVINNAGIVTFKISPEKAIKKNNRPIYLGCLIYAYAREHMYESVLRDYNVIYQDTDSALMELKEYERFCQEKPNLIGENFGQFALEDKSELMKNYITIAPKNYFIMDANMKCLKKGFKGVRLDRDRFIANPGAPELKEYIGTRTRPGVEDEYFILSEKKAFDLYNSEILKTVEKDCMKFIETIKEKNKAYVLCSSLRRCMKNSRDGEKEAGVIYQAYTIKCIKSKDFH